MPSLAKAMAGAEAMAGAAAIVATGHAAARWGAPATFTGAGGVCCLMIVIAAVALGGGIRMPHTHNRTAAPFA